MDKLFTFSFFTDFLCSLWLLVEWELCWSLRFFAFSSLLKVCDRVIDDNIVDTDPSSVFTLTSEKAVAFLEGEGHLLAPVSVLMKEPSPFLATLASFDTTRFPSTGLIGETGSSSWLPSLSAERRWSSVLLFLELPGLTRGCGNKKSNRWSYAFFFYLFSFLTRSARLIPYCKSRMRFMKQIFEQTRFNQNI